MNEQTTQTRRLVIGINGDVGAGKDTLFSCFPEGTFRLAFGDALKREVAEFLAERDPSYVIRFLAGNGCTLSKLREILEETWCIAINMNDEAFLAAIVENEGGKEASEKFVEKHSTLYRNRTLHTDFAPPFLVDQMHTKGVKEQFRTLMRWWGTEYRRQRCRDDYWVEKIRERMAVIPEGAFVAITDARFDNEFAYCREECGGLVVRIERPGTEGTQVHASDTSYRGYDFDVVVQNDGTIDDLRKKVPSLLSLFDLSPEDRADRRTQKEHWLGPKACRHVPLRHNVTNEEIAKAVENYKAAVTRPAPEVKTDFFLPPSEK